jgi:LAS superfamily LD-carboxypeptidase LdcB
MLDPLEVTGRVTTHVVALPELGCTVHRGAAAPLLAMCVAARAEGIEIGIASSFRAFDRQVEIWNAKFRGERTLYDRNGYPLDPSRLDAVALVDAILAWSALPGASRHHWGTDIDIIDAAAVAAGYRAQLLPHEYAPGGVFARLDGWITANAPRFGFFRPYRTDRGGVQPEAWHLSFAPIAAAALEALSLEVLVEAVGSSTMQGREAVLARIPELYERYVKRIDPPE